MGNLGLPQARADRIDTPYHLSCPDPRSAPLTSSVAAAIFLVYGGSSTTAGGSRKAATPHAVAIVTLRQAERVGAFS
jgi:hypothetical protein